MDEYRATNFRNWESRVEAHANSREYNVGAYAADAQHLSTQIGYDREYLGELRGLDVVHLQCHIGTDTVSLARLGANVTGVDFSPSALAVARELAAAAGVDVTFVESELYATNTVLGPDFDLVYTGVGALNWLPDIRGWARVVAGLLRPGGRLYVRDGHPMLMTLDDERADDELHVELAYFEGTPLRFDTPTTYADNVPIAETVTYEWNHGLGEIVQAVIDAGLTVTALRETTAGGWKALPCMVEEDGFWYLPHGRERLPTMFTLEAYRAR